MKALHMETKQYTILVVEAMKNSLLNAAQKLRREHPELGTPLVVLITTNPEAFEKYRQKGVRVIACDYGSGSIETALAQIDVPVKAVICRGDMYVQYLRRLVPHLPPDVKVSSEQALEIATNKRLMRQVFTEQYPEITPQFIRINPAETARVIELTAGLNYPVIVKPASLASSLMIQKCDDAVRLEQTLIEVFERLQSVYEHEKRSETPEVIVEEYLEGSLYSVDSYVLAPGQVFHTPLVSYVAAKQLGIDDFFLYKRITPEDLPEQEVEDAKRAAEKAITAAGLQYSTVHVELIRTADGWKIIEIGPRVGRFRNIMYREAYGIDHGYNDILVHLGLEPELDQKQPISYCAAYSIYPEREGTLRDITGVTVLREHISSVIYESYAATVGQTAHYAKNGGHALYEVIFANDSQDSFETESTWFEAHVRAVVDV